MRYQFYVERKYILGGVLLLRLITSITCMTEHICCKL